MDDDVKQTDLRLVSREPISRENYLARVACLPGWLLDEAGEAWVRDGRVLAILDEREMLFPRFQFDAELQPRLAMALILAELPADMDVWARALWFATPCARLGGDRPMDRLEDPAPAVMAARDLETFALAA